MKIVQYLTLGGVALLPFVLSQGPLLGHYNVNGRTKLLGSSFGSLGVNATYDYLIVGGGTAGLTVAARLAEAGESVAVVEGGSFYELDNGNFSQIPYDATRFSNAFPSSIQPLVDWGIVTPPQPELLGRKIFYAQGKCFGGGSARNYLAYHRSTIGAYNQWAQDVGDSSYTFSNLLPYFKKSCHFTPPNQAKLGPSAPVFKYDASVFSPSGGPLHVSYVNYYAPTGPPVQDAFQKVGMAALDGANSGMLLGYAAVPCTIDAEAQVRSSSETSFGQTAIVSSNLILYHSTLAQRILFDSNKRAVGASVTTGGVSYTLSAKKEVILSAGAFRSPQLLMASGIGPAATLQSHKIPLLSNLSGVGQNLQEQIYFGITYKVNVTTNSQLLVNATYAIEALEEYLTNQNGPLTDSAGSWIGWEKVPASLQANFTSSTKSMLSQFPTDWPDFEIVPLPTQLAPTNDTDNYFSITIAVLSSNSRGNVTIPSRDTSHNPIVNLHWLHTPEDQQVAISAFRRARQVAAAMDGIVVGPEHLPGSAVQTDAEILAFIKETVGPFHHASCTNKMGVANDTAAVVDSHARVFGVQGLRVVDVSTFPFLPPGHPQATVYALAEKMAADILAGS